ncbi:MAG: M1 family metallopeptidase [Clostridiales bacterium]|nr:M1 family metallopeptidase [Clostridiales bacterium]
MRKKITAIILAAAVSLPLAACSPAQEEGRTVYSINATLSADNVLTAQVSVDYLNNTDVSQNELWFNLYPNAYREGAKFCPIPADKIISAYPNGRSYAKLDIESVAVGGKQVEYRVGGEDENVLIVPLDSSLEPTDRVNVDVEYTLKLPNVKHRLGYTNKSVNLANFYPIACVYSGGEFIADPYYSVGDPFYSECADYNVTLSVPSKFTGAFTGEVKSVNEAEDGKIFVIKANNVRDFAAVIGEYEKASGLAGTTVVNYYYYSDTAPEKALNTAIDAINVFSDMFGAYPYPEYSVVQTSFTHGGMEYPNLSMISDAYVSDAYNDIIVHETAHQWWYGVVGNDEVRCAWLDEGLTEYSTMLFYEKADGYNYTFDAKRADALAAYMLYCETYKNNGLGDTSMNRAINEYEGDIEYSYMTYVKGALMLDDVRNAVGDAAFFKGIKNYYRDNKYKIARPEHLIGAIEKTSRKKVGELFDSWLKGNVKLYSKN